MSALKRESEMVFDAPRGRFDFDKPENITDMTDLYRQSNRTTWKNSIIRRVSRKPLDQDNKKLKNQLLAKFCHPSCDMKFFDPSEKVEGLCFKSTIQRNLKHKAPSVMAQL